MKKIMKTILSIFAVFSILSCTKNKVIQSPVGPLYLMDGYFNLSIQNSAKEDLLNKNTKGGFDTTQIKIFRLKNGIKTAVNYEHSPLISKNGTYITLNINFQIDDAILLLQLSNTVTDTLSSTVYKLDKYNYKTIDFKYNGTLKWDESMGAKKTIVIVK